MEALLTFHVENKHAVTHFKRRTFTVQECAMKFGTPVKEAVKSVFKWAPIQIHESPNLNEDANFP